MQQNKEAVLSVKELVKVYRQGYSLKGFKTEKKEPRLAVDSVSFDVYKGEVFGFLGPNGAGKSTTIKIICGLASATSGSVEINGVNIDADPVAAHDKLGAVIENPDFYLEMSGRANLNYFCSIAGLPKSRTDDVLEIVGLSARANDLVKKYSLGMKQRLGIAQALLDDPELLILDEPANGLDPAGIKEIRDLLKYLAHEKNIAVLVSSHQLSEMQLMCDRIAIIDNGKIVSVKEINDIGRDENGGVLVSTSERERAATVIADKFGVVCEAVPGGLLVRIGADKIPEMNKELVLSGVSVSGISERHSTLEDLFMTVTGGEIK